MRFPVFRLTASRRRGGAPGLRGKAVRREPGLVLGRAAFCILCAWFILAGLVMIPYPGVQNDEALFGAGIYDPIAVEYRVSIFKRQVPTMLMSYIGAIKIWLYTAIFAIWPPSPYSLRVPVLLISAFALALSWMLARRTMGTGPATAVAALLATDPIFLLTGVYDWGPVAIQHAALAGGALALVRFHQTGRKSLIALGFFAFGLGLWDKALFVWVLAGLGVAALAVTPRQVFKHVSLRTIVIAAVAFAAGAAPLIRYNGSTGLRTFASNTRYSTGDLDNKIRVLRGTLNGHALLGYITGDLPAGPQGQPRNAIERASVALDDATGGQWTGYGAAALAAAVLLLPFAGPLRRAGLFALVFCVVAWVQMAFNYDTGGGSHHIVLLWPFPQMLMAAAFIGVGMALKRRATEKRGPGRTAEVLPASEAPSGGSGAAREDSAEYTPASKRRLAAATAKAARLVSSPAPVLGVAAIVWVSVFNLLVLNHHLVSFIRGGSGLIWTDAIQPLTDELLREPGREIYVLDWGMLDSLRLLGQGRLKLQVGSDHFSDGIVADDERPQVRAMFQNPRATFVTHVAGKTVFENVQPCFEAALALEGYRKDQERIVKDRMGRPIFSIFTVVPEPRP
jgi:4-amino-4-deoxy-L-arabinose transferase-like glycosyltransferase